MVNLVRVLLRFPLDQCFVFVSLVVLFVAGAIALAGCVQTGGNNGSGGLTGNVSIGPLCPVEPCTVPPERLAAAYEAWPVTISTPEGKPVASLLADPATGYSISLKPGTYVIDIPHKGIGGNRGLPRTVTIRNGETIRLNISIDTGIR